ncbi:MAG: nitroreductase family deazaflavin-dependent oxidoreductase [Caldilineaceae bacterium]|nr:nitroreductase family deazaflavin-dependent oxidoreductase [Caldilineaceae bacterium]MBP8110440.1 nitroreductase family deazaflavin-dependent oxidoreductase [Caldilineaceae bacterium]MBP8123658.1 nitroreductase family deazaflavin-dependent oxidoreductase [Caldilineaceae bacterium]MBP9073098.1 nitroreductase family deazaflavin-dependent oxidoreductase [Caldilineaceae bacterium]
MQKLTPEIEQQLRSGFKYLNKFMLLMWRLGLGWMLNIWPAGFGRIMVITHTGRKSGLRRRTPLNYAQVDGEIYCTAGFGHISDWYRNIMADPSVEVWLPGRPDRWWAGVAEDVSDSPQRMALLREVLIASGFAARAVGIDPVKNSDEELAQVSADYRLLHIRRGEARTGPGGPGDLAWIWPTLVMAWLVRPRRRKA